MPGFYSAAFGRCSAPARRVPHARRPSLWRLAACLALAILPAALATAPARAEAGSKASYFKLGNGMEVVVVPNHRVPIVTHAVWYKVGGAEDLDGQPGLAHFLEHLMFKGTKTYPGNAYEKFIVANGGASINATTSQDTTVYAQSLPKTHLAALMEREADRMVNLSLSDEVVKTEVGVVQNERRGNDNSPSYAAAQLLLAALFPGHPYGRSVIGTESEIATLDRAKALAFYKRYYAPNNAVLVVAGDVTEDEVRTLAESTFGRIPANKDLPKQVVQAVPKTPSTLRIDFEHERVATPSLGFYYATPGTGTLSEPDGVALNLLTRVTGTSIIGRLYRSLVTEQRVAIDFGASHWYDLRGGILSFSATVAPGVSEATLEAALRRELDALVRDGVTAAELEDAKKAFLAGKAYEDDNHRSLANAYGRALALGLTLADVENEDDRAARVTVDDVNRLIARFMGRTEPVVMIMRPKLDQSKVAGAAPK